MDHPRKRFKPCHDASFHGDDDLEKRPGPTDEGVQYAHLFYLEAPLNRSASDQTQNLASEYSALQGSPWTSKFELSWPWPSTQSTTMSHYNASSSVTTYITSMEPTQAETSMFTPHKSRIVNPFSDSANEHLPANSLGTAKLPPTLRVNGYVKFVLREMKDSATKRKAAGTYTQYTGRLRPQRSQPDMSENNRIPRPPRDFGQGFHKDATAGKLWNFYTIGFCAGRTVLKKTNSWLKDLAPMGSGSELVLNTILALSSIYVYEYLPSEGLRRVANRYYARAVRLLDEALVDKDDGASSQRDAVVGAIALLNMADVVTWELRRPKQYTPRWLEGARMASQLLTNWDTTPRYTRNSTIQLDASRISNITVIARAAIFALPTTLLDLSNTMDQFHWLIKCGQRENNCIHGASGLSPRVMYMWAQATHCCAQQHDDPATTVFVDAADKILEQLKTLRQYSEHSTAGTNHAFSDLEDLLARCKLNDDGIVNDAESMTALGGQAWVAALKVYLLCRFYRLPRHHSLVITAIDELAQCIQRMPTSGDYFTAQIPLLPIFMLGLLSVDDDHRSVASGWFEGVLASPICRSSVNPLWPALNRIWDWLPDVIGSGESWFSHDPELKNRDPWWERMVERIVHEEGTLCLI